MTTVHNTEELKSLSPESYDKAFNVTLVNNSLTEAGVPGQLWLLTSLTHLNLAGNMLSSIPTDITQLKSLTCLNLSQNRIAEVSGFISELQALEDLDLGRNQLHSLPSAIGNLPALKYLNLMNNSLSAVPPEIGHLSALYRLGLKGNQLKVLPESVAHLKSLVELFITDNCLVTLPDGMSGLSSLVKLQVSLQSMCVPHACSTCACCCHMNKNCVMVQASFNALETLPAAMGHLPGLELMRVAVNFIEQVTSPFLQRTPSHLRQDSALIRQPDAALSTH